MRILVTMETAEGIYVIVDMKLKTNLLICRGSFVDNLIVTGEIKSSVSVPEFNELVTNQEDETTNNNDTNENHEENSDPMSDSEHIELKESDLWRQTKPITVIKDISKKIKARRASERRRSSEFSDSDAKAAIDLLRMKKTVETMKV